MYIIMDECTILKSFFTLTPLLHLHFLFSKIKIFFPRSLLSIFKKREGKKKKNLIIQYEISLYKFIYKPNFKFRRSRAVLPLK